ncbi:hypothetical protein DH86_00003682 [Scytalidium sp. 3C]|nr:hypothetical protein DH86_00003682 [Scytalidium sp. 3C]
MFHLFDEESFMHGFSEFYQNQNDPSHRRNLWYVHFLLILAFGKAFVVGQTHSRRPAGVEYFVRAMKLLPDITFLHTQPVNSVEILCCVALYLQCLDFRGSAYTKVGEALRIALEEGMHCNMQGHSLDESYVQRCCHVWWTVYILDRQITSFMGVPLAIRDEDITAALPKPSQYLPNALALTLNVKLSRIISQILITVYGEDGQLSKKFVSSTKFALKSIAAVTNQLQESYPLPKNGSLAGISRLSAYLHLLHHQCVVVTTRPLLFSLLKMRLDDKDIVPILSSSSGNARTLLRVCLESSQHILNVLDALKLQSLLDTFLPFDLEAAFAAIIIVLLVPSVDESLLENQAPWVEKGQAIFDSMVIRGNLQAAARQSDVQQLQQILCHMPFSPTRVEAQADSQGPSQLDMGYMETDWQNISADQMMMLADTLDLDSIDWLTIDSSVAVD